MAAYKQAFGSPMLFITTFFYVAYVVYFGPVPGSTFPVVTREPPRNLSLELWWQLIFV